MPEIMVFYALFDVGSIASIKTAILMTEQNIHAKWERHHKAALK